MKMDKDGKTGDIRRGLGSDFVRSATVPTPAARIPLRHRWNYSNSPLKLVHNFDLFSETSANASCYPATTISPHMAVLMNPGVWVPVDKFPRRYGTMAKVLIRRRRWRSVKRQLLQRTPPVSNADHLAHNDDPLT